MGYEVDFIQVGQESKGGDAIALRWGDLRSNDKRNSDQFVVVIDGGYESSGEDPVRNSGKDLAELIKKYYYTNTIDLVVSTHPDADHIGGLSHILDEFAVKKLWIHKPWEHNNDIAKDDYEAAWDLCKQARTENIDIEEPFFDKISPVQCSHSDGVLRVVGPSKEYYKSLLPDFGKTLGTAKSEESILGMAQGLAQEVIARAKDSWDIDSIDDEGETSARNNSSTILEFMYQGRKILFTADAGIPAFHDAFDNVKNIERELCMIQIPHHGSRRNVGPSALNNMVGPIIGKNASGNITAIASCAKENPDRKHPSQRVLNAFIRRGCKCYIVSGGLRHFYKAPDRQGYSKAEACEFDSDVEE